MQGTAFMGAFFAVSPLAERHGLDEAKLFTGIREQLSRKFAKLGERVIADNLRVIERGYRELTPLDTAQRAVRVESDAHVPELPDDLDVPNAEEGVGNRGRFWEQVCFLNKTGSDGIADPFAALSAIPAVTGAARDMTDVRLEVPEFIAAKCTGCAQCWTQCPDSAIPGLVTDVDQLIEIGIAASANGRTLDRIKPVSKHIVKEVRRALAAGPFTSFIDTLDSSYAAVAGKLGWQGEKRAELDADYARLRATLADFPVAKTKPFFDLHESRQAGTGGLLSVTINPEACKGCNLCVAVCPDGALVTVKQERPVVDKLRKNWELWKKLPDTPDRFVNVRDIDEGIGVLSSLLLKKDSYRSMIGGDGACMGCGEKTAVHLIVSTIHALMRPRAAKLVARLGDLTAKLDAAARDLIGAHADLDAASAATNGSLPVSIDAETRGTIELLRNTSRSLADLKWRYVEGPSGEGRASMGMANSTGCSSVWGSTYPYNPYPFPWANHLFQDSPSLAIGLFEGHMRKMADNFVAVRRAELLAAGTYDAARDEATLANLDWRGFTDEEFGLCPPIVSMGGDGAMLDIGFQNLSRLLASGKPIRVIVLDTQVYSNTGGQACTSGFTGQVSDMATYGAAQHGKTEVRKELALIAMAHRGAYVLQSSQASASHLVAGVLRGLQKRRPAVFNIYTPCPVEHGLADDWSLRAARLALESRAFPFLSFDPDVGPLFADALSLDGNPSVDQRWPEYGIDYVDDSGAAQRITLPLTIADWAATEGRFRKHFTPLDPSKWNEDAVPFHEYLDLSAEDRDGKTPYILTVDRDKHLARLAVSIEIVRLAEERQQLWAQLRELAGLQPAASVRDRLVGDVQAEYESKLAAVRAEYEARLAELPKVISRRIADVLLRGGAAKSVVDLLSSTSVAPASNGANGKSAAAPTAVIAPAAAHPIVSPAATEPVAVAAQSAAAFIAVDDDLAIDPYIDSVRCTSCNECTNLNGRLFAYNAAKQATVRDADAGTFQQLVVAAERCPVGIIHPGTPRNPKEKDLAKWLKRAEPFT
jgi:pyruvate-ferredoxin/flavodoxin oxidoreductase